MMGFTPNPRNTKEDMTGKKFGLLTVIGPGPKVELEAEVRTSWKVQCVCGQTENVVTRYLKRGRSHCGDSACRLQWKIEQEKRDLI